MKIYTVDSFTSKPFSGNPAAVCILKEDIVDQLKQDIASEMNLPETAFILPGDEGFGLRWFTPTTEVDLCGHATLAAAHVLWESGVKDKNETVTFHTRSGVLLVRKVRGLIEMEFPREDVVKTDCPREIKEGLNAEILFCGRNRMDYFAEVGSEDRLRSLVPDMASLSKLDSRGLIVTSRSGEYDFISRFFAPQSGIPEDPVTGSAHCALGPYWSEKLEKSVLRAFQASHRGGKIYVGVTNDKVTLAGNAVTVMCGDFCV